MVLIKTTTALSDTSSAFANVDSSGSNVSLVDKSCSTGGKVGLAEGSNTDKDLRRRTQLIELEARQRLVG